MSRPLRIGVFVPQFEGWLDGTTPRWDDILRFARHAEAAGVDSLWLADHMLLRIRDHWAVREREADRVAEEPDRGPWECWTLLSALAATTSEITIGTLVTPTRFRNPALLAKMATTVDEISGGRLVFGIGSGGKGAEYRQYGYPTDNIVSRFEEQLQIITPLLHEGSASFEGRYHVARSAELRPRGPRPAGPPILIAAKMPRMLRLTAQYGDIWNSAWCHTADDAAARIAMIHQACDDIGRNPETLGLTVSMMIDLAMPADGEQANWVTAYRQALNPISGSPAEIADRLHQIAETGISEVQIWLDPCSVRGLDLLASVMEELEG